MAWSPSTNATSFAALVVSELADQGVTAATSLVAKAVYDALQSIGVGGLTALSRSASFSAVAGNHYRCNANAAGITVTLPASSSGGLISIKKIDASANAVTLQRQGGDLIDGATTLTLSAQWSSVQILATSAGWDVIAKV